jgi:hypothetical protein
MSASRSRNCATRVSAVASGLTHSQRLDISVDDPRPGSAGRPVERNHLQTIDVHAGNLSFFWNVHPKDENNNLQMAVDGTYSITCDMPPLALLLRYVVGEEGSTDHQGGF